MLGIGAIAKSVQDAELVNDIIATQKPVEQKLNSFKVVIPIENLQYPVNPATLHALNEVKKALENDMPIFDEEPVQFREAALNWQLIMSIENKEGGPDIAFNGRPAHYFREFLKERLTQKSDLHYYYTWASFGANLFKPSPKKVQELESTIAEGEKEVQDYLQRKILILPVYHTTALPHGKVYWQLFSIFKTFKKYIPFVAYANTWGLPSLTIPVAEDENGLPIGIQVISSVGNENAIFQVGRVLENKLRGFELAPINKLLK